MLTPRSAARARSTLMRSSGCVGSKFVSTSTTPGISRTFVHQLHGVLLQLLDVGPLNQDVQPVEAAAAAAAARRRRAAAAGGRAGDVGAARDADACALVLAQHLPRLDHQLLLGDVPLLERQHHDVEVREPRVHVLHHPLQPRQREDFLFDRLDELLGALVAGAAREAHVDAEFALVVVGDELLADVRIQEGRRQHDDAGDAPSSRDDGGAPTPASVP